MGEEVSVKKRLLKIALAQLRCELLNKESNLSRIIDSIKTAKEKNADYILFPELFLSGYVMSPKLYDLAEPVTGNSIRTIAKAAEEHHIGVIVGYPEKYQNNIYNSATFIDQNGNVVCTYRKTHLYHEEVQYFEAGNEFPVIELPEGKMGMIITYDIEFPEVARLLAMKGVDVIFVLEANMVPYQKYQDVYLHARALENHIFVVAVNKVGLHVDNVFFGESQVVHPNGTSIYKAGNNEEIPVIEINLDEREETREPLDYLNNRRSDLY